jgi:hypothetical protein
VLRGNPLVVVSETPGHRPRGDAIIIIIIVIVVVVVVRWDRERGGLLLVREGYGEDGHNPANTISITHAGLGSSMYGFVNAMAATIGDDETVVVAGAGSGAFRAAGGRGRAHRADVDRLIHPF